MSDAGRDDFADVMQEFQNIETPSAPLVEAVRRGRARLVRGRVLLAVIWVGLYVVAALRLAHGVDAAGAVGVALDLAIPPMVFAFGRWSSRRSWEARAETTRGFLELELERRRDRCRRMRFVRRLAPAVAAVVGVQQALMVRNGASISPGLVFAFALPHVLLTGIVLHSLRRQARYEREAEELAGRILDLDPGPVEL